MTLRVLSSGTEAINTSGGNSGPQIVGTLSGTHAPTLYGARIGIYLDAGETLVATLMVELNDGLPVPVWTQTWAAGGAALEVWETTPMVPVGADVEALLLVELTTGSGSNAYVYWSAFVVDDLVTQVAWEAAGTLSTGTPLTLWTLDPELPETMTNPTMLVAGSFFTRTYDTDLSLDIALSDEITLPLWHYAGVGNNLPGYGLLDLLLPMPLHDALNHSIVATLISATETPSTITDLAYCVVTV